MKKRITGVLLLCKNNNSLKFSKFRDVDCINVWGNFFKWAISRDIK